jgi:N-acetylglucosamine kinase-like BadF-type ATPase
VLEAAAGGERSASKIVQQAALDLFELLRALARSAGLDGKTVPLVFAGGLLGENSLLSYLLETRIASEFPLMHIVKGSDPIDGALAKARELLVVS